MGVSPLRRGGWRQHAEYFESCTHACSASELCTVVEDAVDGSRQWDTKQMHFNGEYSDV